MTMISSTAENLQQNEEKKKKIKDVAKALSESRPQPDSKAEVGPLESCE